MVLGQQIPLPFVEMRGSDATVGPPLIDREFDVELADTLARQESFNKHLYRPNTYLHKWWARRCGSTFRAILKHLQSSTESSDYYAPEGLAGLVILDPMMGGGTTLHEAIRLGANVIGADIDPIPILQARASLSQIPWQTLERAFNQLYQDLYRDLGGLFRTTCPECGLKVDSKFFLYASRRECDCGEALVVDSLVLRHNADGSTVRICEQCHDIVTTERCHCVSVGEPVRIVEKGRKVCDRCGGKYRERLDLPFYQRYVPIAVVGDCTRHGLFFRKPGAADIELMQRADAARDTMKAGIESSYAVEAGPKSRDLVSHGISSYLDLFSSRQRLYLSRATSRLQAFDPLVRLNLALLVSTSLEFNSMLCGYKGGGVRRPGAVRHVFAHHAYTFPYTALENNPLYREAASGTLRHLFRSRIKRARTWAADPVERRVEQGKVRKTTITGEVDAGVEVTRPEELSCGDHKFMLLQGSSARLRLPDDSVDHIVTDPPYFDSVQYSDLAAFFRVWLRDMVPGAAVWDYAIEESAVDPQANGNGQYAAVLGGIFSECSRVLKRASGRMVFTYHHWDPKAWAALTKALKQGGFILVNRYVVHSENPASVHILNLNSLRHDAILVLASVESGIARRWERPSAVDASDSRLFCEDCASSLGWMLDEALTDDRIDEEWGRLLTVR